MRMRLFFETDVGDLSGRHEVLRNGRMSKLAKRMRTWSPLAGLATVLGVAAAAWACTPQAELVLMPPEAAPGGEVSVEGLGMIPGSTVDIYWNSLDDRRAGAAIADEQGRFRTEVPVPFLSSQALFVVAVDRDDTAKIARAVLRVSGALEPQKVPVAGPLSTRSEPQVAAADDLWTGFEDQPDVTETEARSPRPHDRVAARVGLGAVLLSFALLMSLPFLVISQSVRKRVWL